MFISRALVKTEAKTRLAGQGKSSAVVTFISWLFPGFLFPSGIGPLLLDGPFSAGMAQYFLRVARGESGGIGSVFLGFSKFLRNVGVWVLQVVFVLLWACLLVVPGVVAALRYSMVWFLLVDEPDLTARQALDRSKALTKGHLWDLFTVWMSFFWWFLFGIVTMGIGFLWVIPYAQTTLALVYEGLKTAEART